MPGLDTVVVMARRPAPGEVKTRLARAIGAAAALQIYRAFLGDLQEQLREGPWRLLWAVHPPGEGLGDLVAPAACVEQRGDDLGARMRNAFADLRAGGAGRVVMLGADAPHLGRAGVEAAFAALDATDVVLAPSRDGGYCLIGMRLEADVFSGITMSTARVCRETQERARQLGLSCALLAETFDVDERGDLDDLAALIRRGEVRLSRTAAVLRELGW